jgi:hypothetical protein
VRAAGRGEAGQRVPAPATGLARGLQLFDPRVGGGELFLQLLDARTQRCAVCTMVRIIIAFLLRRALFADLVDGTATDKREAIVLIPVIAALLSGYLPKPFSSQHG